MSEEKVVSIIPATGWYAALKDDTVEGGCLHIVLAGWALERTNEGQAIVGFDAVDNVELVGEEAVVYFHESRPCPNCDKYMVTPRDRQLAALETAIHDVASAVSRVADLLEERFMLTKPT